MQQTVLATAARSSMCHTSRDTQAGEYTVNITTAATQSTSTSNNGTVGENETLTITDGDNIAEVDLTTDMTLSGYQECHKFGNVKSIYGDVDWRCSAL